MKKLKNFFVLCTAAFCFSAALMGCGNSMGNKIVYKVVFDSQGGSAVATQNIKRGEKVTKPDDPTKDGYDFLAWYEDSVAVTPFDFDIEITADWTLYAGWRKSSGGGGDLPTDGAAVKVGATYYSLIEYADGQNPIAAWKNENVNAETNDEVFFFINGEAKSVYSDGDSNGNNITEVHPMSTPVASVHIKKGGNVAIYFKQWESAYTFWITTPSGGGDQPGEGYSLQVGVASDFASAYNDSGAVTYVYAFKGDTDHAWYDAQSGSVTIANQYDKFIVVRMDPSKAGDWSGKWNQTADITVDTNKSKVTITGWGSGTLAYTYE